MEIQLLDLLNITTTVVAGVVGWFVGRRKQKNDFLTELQSSIDLLSNKNKELLEEVVRLREENAKLRFDIEELTRKFNDVKIITKKVKSDETS